MVPPLGPGSRHLQAARRFARIHQSEFPARIPIGPDPQPTRLEKLDQTRGNIHCAVFMECAVIAERMHVEFQRLGFDKPIAGHIIDDDVSEIWLSRHRAHGREFWNHKPRHILLVAMAGGHSLQNSSHRIVGNTDILTELGQA